MQDLAGKVGVVTGGASGIGRAMALRFADEGMNVVIADVEDEPSAKVRAEIEQRGVKGLALHTDVSTRAALEELADHTFSEMGAAHVLCNNAGVGVGGPLDEMTDDDWRWVMGVNLDGVVYGLQAFLPRLKEQNQGGHIVNTASMAGMFAAPGLGVYNTTKFAVVGLSETLRLDLAPHNIGVSVLCPGWVRTGIADSNRNRPDTLTDTVDRSAEMEEARVFIEQGIDASVVADRVAYAIKHDEMYIFTHPEMREWVELRFAQITAAFDTAETLAKGS